MFFKHALGAHKVLLQRKSGACCWFFNGDGSDNPQELFQVEKFR